MSDKKPKEESEEEPKPSTSQDGQRSEDPSHQVHEAQEGLHHSEEDPLVVGSSGQEERQGVGEPSLYQDPPTRHDHLAVLMRIEQRLERAEERTQQRLERAEERTQQRLERVEGQIQQGLERVEGQIQQLQANQRRQWILRQLLKWSLHILVVAGIVATYVVYAGKDLSTFISLFIIIFFSSKATWLLCETIDNKMRRRSTRHVK